MKTCNIELKRKTKSRGLRYRDKEPSKVVLTGVETIQVQFEVSLRIVDTKKGGEQDKRLSQTTLHGFYPTPNLPGFKRRKKLQWLYHHYGIINAFTTSVCKKTRLIVNTWMNMTIDSVHLTGSNNA
jgi:hypothetical protein